MSNLPTAGMTRRLFLRRAAACAGVAAAMPNFIESSVLGNATSAAANDRITMGVIGLGGRGQHVTQVFMSNKDVQFVAACDVQKSSRERGKAIIDEKNGNSDCATYIDFRELLDRKDIDAVLIATGDNWHSLASIMAARAGKDMYCEKPMSVALTESREVVKTMARYGRVYQCGTQRRNIDNFRLAAGFVHQGMLGKLHTIHAETSEGFVDTYDTVLEAEPEPPREEMAWDLWLGPALWRPYNRNTPTRGFWSAHQDFSGGSITEWGTHTVDLCQWANESDDTLPLEYWPEGDQIHARYANGVKLVLRRSFGQGSCAVRYEGEEGWVETDDSGKVVVEPAHLLGGQVFPGGYSPANHVREFLDCVHSRGVPTSNAEVAHRAISVCHVANICRRLGRPVKFDPTTERFVNDPEADRFLSRAYREPWRL
ncbi:MAG: Gfo/Idh/MocA family oxidoreductase [Verrucomicrobiota bacterium]|jgi:predicted dehydrogenase|nr:Gfo/Idh/MocA family oxidoreductase [Verrucomicrobiota bacterium]MDD8045482.1 Gfo/Idh/MocA family oxidoreductase [Verrucomicrobiota bacterium]MDD8051528.1 Gfo/Idh/MocA family oxidoreductase [Verrucomicrobiota bacterium]HCF94059.1 gfo/Idh/MocA family oxidoreductase [Verrucomicrobiota bacterium]